MKQRYLDDDLQVQGFTGGRGGTPSGHVGMSCQQFKRIYVISMIRLYILYTYTYIYWSLCVTCFFAPCKKLPVSKLDNLSFLKG